MKTTFREENGKYIATLEGRLDTVASEQTAKDLSVLDDCTGHDIVIDCTKLEYISSSGLRILLNLRKTAAAVRGSAGMLFRIHIGVCAVALDSRPERPRYLAE